MQVVLSDIHPTGEGVIRLCLFSDLCKMKRVTLES